MSIISVDQISARLSGAAVTVSDRFDVSGGNIQLDGGTGVITATSFKGSGANLTGIAVTSDINTNNIKVSGISTLGTATADSIVVGSAVTVNGSGIKAGIITANSFSGDGSSLTGVAATDYVVANTLKVLGVSTFVGNTQLTATTASTSSATGALVVSGGVGIAGSLHVGENVSVGGTLTYEDVTNVDVIGFVTARTGIQFGVAGAGGTILASGNAQFSGIVTASGGAIYAIGAEGSAGQVYIYSDEGDDNADKWRIAKPGGSSDFSIQNYQSGSWETSIKAFGEGRTELYDDNSRKLTTMSTGVAVVGLLSATTLSGNGSALTNLPAAGLNTSASTISGIVSTLALSSAQDHKVTVSGISTFTCNGGTEGESHTLRITNSGITTVGFSTYFLFPGGSSPSLPTADGSISLISFTVHRVGTPGIATQLLAGASVNYS